MKYLWIAGAALLAVAVLAVWFNFSDPQFIAGLVAVVAGAIWGAAPKLLKRMTPEEEERWHDAVAAGESDRWDSATKRVRPRS